MSADAAMVSVPPSVPDGASETTGVGCETGSPSPLLKPDEGVEPDEEQPIAKIAAPMIKTHFAEKRFIAPPPQSKGNNLDYKAR